MPKKQSNISDREFKYWLTKNCSRQNSWIVVARFGEIISHDGHLFYDELGHQVDELPLKADNLEYVYIANLSPAKLIAIVQVADKYYVIKNFNNNFEDKNKADDSENDVVSKPVDSTIHMTSSIDKAISLLSSAERKEVGLKKRHKITLKPKEQKALEGIVNIDFVGKSKSEQCLLWDKLLAQSGDTLDLSGMYLIDPEVMGSGSKRKFNQIKTVILYQNNLVTRFEWILKLPALKTLSIWFSNQLEDNMLENLSAYGKTIQELEFHFCYKLTGRALIEISKLPLLDKLIMDNPVMSCQENTFETVIKPKEWRKIENSSLQLVMINSDNMTVDFIDYMLISFPNVERYVLSDKLIDKLHQDSAHGYEKDEIIFQSFADTSKGFKRYKKVRMLNLLKNKVDRQKFSDSMLKIIEKNNPTQFAAIVEELKQNSDDESEDSNNATI